MKTKYTNPILTSNQIEREKISNMQVEPFLLNLWQRAQQFWICHRQGAERSSSATFNINNEPVMHQKQW